MLLTFHSPSSPLRLPSTFPSPALCSLLSTLYYLLSAFCSLRPYSLRCALWLTCTLARRLTGTVTLPSSYMLILSGMDRSQCAARGQVCLSLASLLPLLAPLLPLHVAFTHSTITTLTHTPPPGAYDAHTFGPRGKRVTLVLLDVRYFKDETE
jgi:hypothetical protein